MATLFERLVGLDTVVESDPENDKIALHDFRAVLILFLEGDEPRSAFNNGFNLTAAQQTYLTQKIIGPALDHSTPREYVNMLFEWLALAERGFFKPVKYRNEANFDRHLIDEQTKRPKV